MSEITFYDLPSRDPCRCWSLNPWKSVYSSLSFTHSYFLWDGHTVRTIRRAIPLTSNPSARLLLNFKNIPYRTHWLEYPDIASAFESLNVKPNPSSAPTPYSIPAITLPDGKTHIMDSMNIAEHLDQTHPSPPIHLNDPITEKTVNAVTELFNSIRPIIIPRVRKSRPPIPMDRIPTYTSRLDN